MIVVIDGPAGSGKSSTARAVAERLKIQYLDSGALYRVATLIYLQADRNREVFIDLLKESKISFYFKQKKFHVFLDDIDVSEDIRSMKVSDAVSEVATMPDIRSYINQLMREQVKKDIYIADGRDLGTAVFTDAAMKFFMVADLNDRAKRRFRELSQKGIETSLEEVKANIAGRDQVDSSREADPLKQAEDAILINTSGLTFEEQVTQISNRVKKLITEHKH